MDASNNSTLGSSRSGSKSNATKAKVVKKTAKLTSPSTSSRLPPRVPWVRKQYVLRIKCPYLPYSSCTGSRGRMVLPSINEIPSSPIAPTNIPSFPWKQATPRPTLSINFNAGNIVLTWRITHKASEDYAPTVLFDLYIHEVPKVRASSPTWKRVLELNVQDLPQTCNSIELRAGSTYYFSLCAVDGDSRCGKFSIPRGISLLPC